MTDLLKGLFITLAGVFLLAMGNDGARAAGTHSTTATPDVTISLSAKAAKPGKPYEEVCVGLKDGCAETLSGALKGLKSGGTVYVMKGSGLAENISIKKRVTICASADGTTCLAAPAEAEQFHLIPRNRAKACLSIKTKPAETTSISGLHLRGAAGSDTACIKVSRGGLALAHSDIANSSLQADGATSVSIDSSYLSAEITLSGLDSLSITNSMFFGADTLIAQTRQVTLEGNEFTYGTLFFDSNFSLIVQNQNLFESVRIGLSGRSFQSFSDNTFKDVFNFTVGHDGDASFADNLFEGSTLSLESGTNRLTGNVFGLNCTSSTIAGAGAATSGGPAYTCAACTSSSAITYTGAGDGGLSVFSGNYVCTGIAGWLSGAPGPNDNVRANCLVTDTKGVQSDSKSLYRPNKDLYILFTRNPKRAPRNPGICSGFL